MSIKYWYDFNGLYFEIISERKAVIWHASKSKDCPHNENNNATIIYAWYNLNIIYKNVSFWKN